MEIKTHTQTQRPYPLLKAEDRIAVWERASSVWKRHKWDALKEHKKMRKEWERQLLPRR